MQVSRQSTSFAPENENDVLGLSEWSVPEFARSLRGKEPWLTQRRQRVLERRPVGPYVPINMVPVVQSGALDLPFIE